MRGLTNDFMNDLKTGDLSVLLQQVVKDDTLCLAIRENYINVYYRGCNLLRVETNGKGYKYIFNDKYLNHQPPQYISMAQLQGLSSIVDYIKAFPLLKQEMDLWFHDNKRQYEREFQQHVMRDNNINMTTTTPKGTSNDTDYFVADIEYTNTENGSRFDLIGVKWPSTGPARKNGKVTTLAIMEMKYGDGAMNGDAGIIKHFKDMDLFVKNGKLTMLAQEAETQFNQLYELGLVKGINKPIQIDMENQKPEYLLLPANHKPASTVLKRELTEALRLYPDVAKNYSIKIAQSCYMGYGLYSKQMISIGEFLETAEVEEVGASI
ncbi:MAG: hypothetical protein PWP56_1340 [Acetobacterium sp.]|nr:hypothetical protein [Acetobacterium sp.]